MQRIITPENNYQMLDEWIGEHRLLLVSDSSLQFFAGVKDHLTKLEESGKIIVHFSDFQPNPLYENVLAGVDLFRREQCDAIMAIGGGSAIDVAKCIRLYNPMPGDGADGSFLTMEPVIADIPFLAMPTTAGTGSEATRYAVIYFEGIKQSVTHDSLIPKTVLIDPSCLKTLPIYQKKATMMDALCHAIESYWSINSTEESRTYSDKAIRQVMRYKNGYLTNTEDGNRGMLMAANIAGKAINITQTTAGHAMCYKITSLFGCAHGHAAALCMRRLFHHMVANIDKCIDPRGEGYLKKTLDSIGMALGSKNAEDGAYLFASLFDEFDLLIPEVTEEQLTVLATSVNPVRLKNHPVKLDDVSALYREILGGKHEG